MERLFAAEDGFDPASLARAAESAGAEVVATVGGVCEVPRLGGPDVPRRLEADRFAAVRFTALYDGRPLGACLLVSPSVLRLGH